MDQQGGKQTSKSGNKEVGEHMKMAELREKLARKSKDITETPTRNLSGAITPNTKKASKREQDPPKIKEHEEEGAAEVFWGPLKMPYLI
jgi:hypothetical protein